MPHSKKVTQIKADYLKESVSGGRYGINHEREEAVARQVRSRRLKAGRKEKSAILEEFVRMTGCNRKGKKIWWRSRKYDGKTSIIIYVTMNYKIPASRVSYYSIS